MAAIRVQLLGPVTVESAAGGPPLLTQPVRVGILAYLLLARPRGMHSRDTIVAMFWPESSAASGRHALRNALHGVRRALGDGVIVTSGDNLVGIDRTAFVCDVLQVEEDLASARGIDAVMRSESELMRGFHVQNAAPFEHWLDAEGHRLKRMLLTAAWSAVSELRSQNRNEEALVVAQRARQLAPDHEPTIRHVIELLAESGDRAAAIHEYDAFAAHLAAEYDTTPAAETTALAAQVRPALPTRDAEAYVLYVRGTFLFLRGSHGGHLDELERSRGFFERALARDPSFAPAIAGLSNYYSVAATRELLKPFHEYFARAIELSHRALEIDPFLAIPHVHFGVKALYLEQNWDLARTEFTRAIEIDPLYAEGHRFLGVLLIATGDVSGGLREMRAAAMLEPEIALYYNGLGAALMIAEQWDDAIHALQTAVQLDTHYKAARERLIRCYEATHRYEEAIAQRQAGSFPDADQFARAFSDGGESAYIELRARELRSTIARLEARLANPADRTPSELMNPIEVPLAVAYAELGDAKRAAECEEAACTRNPGLRPWFAAQPILRRI